MADRTIIDRVAWADGIVAQTPDHHDPETDLTDVLGELMHWAQARDLDFAGCLRQAADHFDHEDRGIDVATMSPAAYRKVYGVRAAQRRADRWQNPDPDRRCGWCQALITDHTAGELATCKGYGGGV